MSSPAPPRPLHELKRRLSDASVSLPKRLRLAANVATTQYFPAVPKERILAEWLAGLADSGLIGEEVLQSVLSWLGQVEEPTAELQGKAVEVVAKYLEGNVPEREMTKMIINFLESENILTQLTLQTHHFLLIMRRLLSHLQSDTEICNTDLCVNVFNLIVKVYKVVTKKVDFIIKFLKGETLETILMFLDSDLHRSAALNVCQTILFPLSKKQHYVSFLQTLIKKESIDQLLEEKGDNIKSVLKVMSAFFTFPTGRTSKDANFLINFIDAFVTSYRSDSQLIFAFFIMAINSLNIQQTYLNPTISMPTIYFDGNDEKVKRNIFQKALECLTQNEIDLNVRLTESLGESLSKVEIKKNFVSFLQASIIKILKLEGKPDKMSLKIITLSLKLDPNLIEPKLEKILPSLMIAKKNKIIQGTYTEMLNCILETLFKLNKGMEFLSKMLPLLKIQLEAINAEQFQLKQELKIEPHSDKIKSKIVWGEDLFPKACIDKYGRLTAELMLRQCGELFVTLQREFEEHCLIMLAEGFVSPSLITLAEVLSAVLSSCLCYNKMADHTVPLHTAEEFWSNFQILENSLLRKFGECLLKLSYNRQLALSFLQLCLSYSKLKLLSTRYSNLKLDTNVTAVTASDIFDFSMILTCLNTQQWLDVASRVNENQDGECVELLNHLQLIKIMALDLQPLCNEISEIENYKKSVKTSLIKDLDNNWSLVEDCPFFAEIVFSDLDKRQTHELSMSLVKLFGSNPEAMVVMNSVAVSNNRTLLMSLVMETLKSLLKIMENKDFLNNFPSLRKACSKDGFDFSEFVKSFDIVNYFREIGESIEESDHSKILHGLECLKMFNVHNLDETSLLVTIFVILALKNNTKSKNISLSVDSLLISLFELSPKNPDLFKIFPVKFLFDFEDCLMLNLINLNRITTTNPSIVVKAVLETATKKVKTDSEIIKNVVKILLSKQKTIKKCDSSIEHFSDKVFQITCMALPIIAKEKKSITTSAYRSILAELQEKLHKSLLKSFKNVDLDAEKNLFSNKIDLLNDSLNEGTLATLNSIEAYSLTLSKYCDSGNTEDSQNLDCLLSSLEYFVGNAIIAIENTQSKPQHVDASVQMLNVIFRRHNVPKLATNALFQDKDQLFLRIWQALKCRLKVMCQGNIDRSDRWDEMTVAVKFLAELCSVTFFIVHLAVDLANLMVLVKPPSAIINSADPGSSVLTSHRVARFLWSSTLKANVTGPKSAALLKATYTVCRNLKVWLRTHYVKSADENVITDFPREFVDVTPEIDLTIANDQTLKDVPQKAVARAVKSQSSNEIMLLSDRRDGAEMVLMGIQVPEVICELLKCDLETLSEVVLSAKKVSLNYKFMDAIFEVLQLVNHCMLNCDSVAVSLTLCDAVSVILNSLLLSRDEMLEDRWPCYLQCYRPLVLCVARRSAADGLLERALEERVAESAHSLEKLTQAICKRRSQVSRLAAYLVADVCSVLERSAPSRPVRQHLENSVALLIQASESTYAMSFLRRALAGNPGQMTMTNLYTMYKRYHKYVGTS